MIGISTRSYSINDCDYCGTRIFGGSKQVTIAMINPRAKTGMFHGLIRSVDDPETATIITCRGRSTCLVKQEKTL